jgi:tetratricopeptide (TPR) repeat protein
VNRLVVGLVLASALLVSACGRSTPPSPSAARSPQLEHLRGEAEARLVERDWERALAAFRQALAQAPDDVRLRYGLGVAAAHLDRRDEAIAAFRWVSERGPADLEEVRVARQWLRDAGVGAVAATPAPAAPVVAQTTGDGVVQGRTEWAALEAGRSRPRVQVLLEGDDLSTRGRRYSARVLLNDAYRIAGVAPGRYRLMAQVGATRLWDTRVSVPETGATTLDLTAATAVASPDALRFLAD